MTEPLNLSIGHLSRAYRDGTLRPADVGAAIMERIPDQADDDICIRPLEPD